MPHGGTIPKKGERLVEAYQDRLSETTEPGLYILQRVYDTYELLKFLDQIHLQIGDTIAFQRYDDYTGLYHFVIHGQEISINQVIAQQLYIEKTCSLILTACFSLLMDFLYLVKSSPDHHWSIQSPYRLQRSLVWQGLLFLIDH